MREVLISTLQRPKILVFCLSYNLLGKDQFIGSGAQSSSRICYARSNHLRKNAIFNIKSVLIPNSRYRLTQRLHINKKKSRLWRHPALGKGYYAQGLKIMIEDKSN